MGKRLPKNGHWAAVGEAIDRRLKELDWSTARLSRESGITESTIRNIKEPKQRNRSTLVALCGPLGYPPDYLVDVHSGEASPKEPPPSPAEMAFIKNLFQAEISPLKQLLETIDGKVTTLLTQPEKRDPR